MGREEGGGFRMGTTCIPVAYSFWYKWQNQCNIVKLNKIKKKKKESESEVSQSCPTLCDPMDTRLPHPWDFLGKSTGLGCHFLLQGIFPTQGLNPGLPHCRQTLYRLSHWATWKAPALGLFSVKWNFNIYFQRFFFCSIF